MQTRLRWVIVMGLGGLIASANALAVAPEHGAVFSGSGADYMNDHSAWTPDATGNISFRTSSSGNSVIDFRGGYSFYCGSGTATVTEQRMSISHAGKFGTRFKVASRGPSGRRNGTAYVWISGVFATNPTSAKVLYLVDYVFNGRHVKHPYNTSRPRRLGCASWVKGTVTTTSSSSPSPSPPQSHPQPEPPTGHP